MRYETLVLNTQTKEKNTTSLTKIRQQLIVLTISRELLNSMNNL